jgi:hypothetical protein
VTVQLTHPFICQLAGDGGDDGDDVMCQADPAGGAGGNEATASVQDRLLTLWLTDAENPQPVNVTNSPASVPVGEAVWLTAEVNGAPVDVDWTAPGNNQAVVSYDPGATADQLWKLGVPGEGANAGSRVVSDTDSITFEWVSATPSPPVITATIPGTTTSVTASFSVRAPNVTVQATPLPAAYLPPHAKYVDGTYFVTPCPTGATDLWMDPLGWGAATPAGWDYCFAQTVSVWGFFTLPKPDSKGNAAGTYVNCDPTAGLDYSFPLPPDKTKPPAIGNGIFQPGPMAVLSDGPGTKIYPGGSSQDFLAATTYYMCEPVDSLGVPIGGWVPVAKLCWTYFVDAQWYPVCDSPTVLYSSGKVSGSAWSNQCPFPMYSFQATTEFPQWSGVASSDAEDLATGVLLK